MQKYILELTVFLSGFIVLTYEVVGARILGPYYGTSTFVWTAMIGIILASLSIGYYIGGRLADRKDARIEHLANMILYAGLAIAVTYIIRKPLLEILSQSTHDIRIGSVIAAIILFLPASILLGMVSPYAVKLRIEWLKSSGSTIGNMSALGTLGSILGTFISWFYLIPHFGMSIILGILPLSLIFLSLLIAPHNRVIFKTVSSIVLIFIFFSLERAYAWSSIIEETDTLYSHIRIYDKKDAITGERLRTMGINIENHSTMSLDSDRLVNQYTKYYHLVRHFFPEFSSGLMLWGAGYSFPKDYLAKYPHNTLDVVEIDPGVTDLAKKYFALEDHPNLTIHHEDARVFLNQNTKKFDAIFGDAFTSWYSVPYQLTTQEAIQKQYDSLSDNGVVILNIISAIEGEMGELLRAEYKTFKTVFPQVYILPVSSPKDGTQIQNIVLIALKSKTPPSWESQDRELAWFLSQRWALPIDDDMPLLTDDYAPVDHYVGKFLKEIRH